MTFGRVSTKTLGQRAAAFEEGGEEELQRADAAVADRRLHALDPDTDVRRRAAVGDGRRHQTRGTDRLGVLLGVGARAVAVLEVDPQVLDRLAHQLGPDPGVHLGDQVVGGDAQGLGQLGGRAGVVSSASRACRPQVSTVSAAKASAGTYTVWTGCRLPESPG